MNMIALVDDMGGLGANGKLLYIIKEDMDYFKKLTQNKVVVMGRKTFDSLPYGPLPNRTNIVLTSDTTFSPEGVIVVHNYHELITELQANYATDDVFIIGGTSLYKEFLDKCDTLYINRLHVAGYYKTVIDTFFPNFDEERTIQPGWDLVSEERHHVRYHLVSTGELNYAELSFLVFKRNERFMQAMREVNQPTLQSAT